MILDSIESCRLHVLSASCFFDCMYDYRDIARVPVRHAGIMLAFTKHDERSPQHDRQADKHDRQTGGA